MYSKELYNVWYEVDAKIEELEGFLLFGELFDEILSRLPISQAEFSHVTGIPQSTISEYKTEKRLPGFVDLKSVTQYLYSLDDEFCPMGNMVLELPLKEALVNSLEIREFRLGLQKAAKKKDAKAALRLLQRLPTSDELGGMHEKIDIF